MAHLIKAFCSFVIIQSFILWSPAYAQQPGDLDLSFGVDGITTVDANSLGKDDGASSIRQLNSGDLIISGAVRTTGFPYQSDMLLAKFNPNGALVIEFGTNGFVITDLGGDSEGLVGIYLETSGNILCAGTSNQSGLYEHLFVQYDANGNLNTSFGTNGVIYNSPLSTSSTLTAVSFQSEAIYTTGTINGNVLGAKYETNGLPINSFGTSGSISHNLGLIELTNELALQSDGKIVLAGYQATSGNPEDVLVCRLNTDGSLDNSFNMNGWVNLALSSNIDRPRDVVILEDGKILVVGFVFEDQISDSEIFALRLTPDGSYDNSFGTNGIARYDIGAGDDYANDVVLQPDGKALIGGSANNGNDNNFCLLRINPYYSSPENKSSPIIFYRSVFRLAIKNASFGFFSPL